MAYSVSKAEVLERLVHDVALWQADGLISAETAAQLRERYQLRAFGLGQVMRYLGIIGVLFVGLGILGLITAMAGSEIVMATVLCALAAGGLVSGVRLTRDPLGRYRWSAKIVLTLTALVFAAGIASLVDAVGLRDRSAMLTVGAIVIPALAAAAYVYRIGILLVIAVLGFFHWIGTWTSMFGRSTYAVQIQDPRLIAVVALLVIGIGLWHEHDERLRERTGRFYRIHESLGLVYLNLSLLILSIEAPGIWAFALLAATIAQIAGGSRLHNSLLVGFGVTFMFINGFTRYYEHFWDAGAKGIFFLLGGGITFAVGLFCEGLARAQRQETA